VPVSTRDHSAPFHPFLQDLGIPLDRAIYWGSAGRLHWFDRDTPNSVPGDAARWAERSRQLAPGESARWLDTHDPEDLWRQWNSLLYGQRFLVEHTSVNPVHPLHAGSLRSTVIGAALARLLRSAGADVEVRYFVNDHGRQVTFLRRIVPRVRWELAPHDLRTDELVGVLYALANMQDARRMADIERLTGRYPWLPGVVDVTASLGEAAGADIGDLIVAMVNYARQDLVALGAAVDVFDWESRIPHRTSDIVLDLIHRLDTVKINGVWCLRRPDGLVPLQRPDGSSLYFTRDVANTRERCRTARTILHVIGDDQLLLQGALRQAVPEAAIEHIAFAPVSNSGKKFSGRQNRLLTVPALLRDEGEAGLWGLALAMLMRRRTVPLDIALLDRARPLQTVLVAHRVATRCAGDASGRDGRDGSARDPRDASDRDAAWDAAAWWDVTLGILQTPGVLYRSLITRTPHRSARLLVDLSARFLATAARHPEPPGWVTAWFLSTQSWLADLQGLPLSDLAFRDQRSPAKSTLAA